MHSVSQKDFKVKIIYQC